MDNQDILLTMLKQMREDNNTGHNEIIKRLDYTNGNVMSNTKFRLSTQAIISLLKWGIPLVGITGIINIFMMFKR